MVRWVRIVALGVLLLALICLGVGVGLFLVGNSAWIPVDVPPWLVWIFGYPEREVWLPALIAGWLGAILFSAALLVWSLYYVWRRRQYEGLIEKLETELADLRNLPFTNPAPFEDLPEPPDPAAARILAEAERAQESASPISGELDA
jgi:hypothetical protein